MTAWEWFMMACRVLGPIAWCYVAYQRGVTRGRLLGAAEESAKLDALVPHPEKPSFRPINEFEGTFFPAPHDPRWRCVPNADPAKGYYAFAGGEIIVRLGCLSVGGVIVATGDRPSRYACAIGEAICAERTRAALARAEQVLLRDDLVDPCDVDVKILTS